MNQGKNALLSALADPLRRSVIAYFRNAPEDYAPVDDVAAALSRRDHADETRIAIRLHHAALPKLDDVGVVDYDARTRTIRYRGHPDLEHLEGSLSVFGPELSQRND